MMKKIICAVAAVMLSMLCVGCGETPSNYDGPSYVPAGFLIHLLGIENDVNDGEGLVGFYHSCINENNILQVELTVGKEYRICSGQTRSYYLSKERIIELLEAHDGYLYGIERELSPDIEQDGYDVEFEYDDSVMTVETETKTRVDVRPDGYSKEISWNEYKIVGLREGSTQFAVKQEYSTIHEGRGTYTYNMTLVFTADKAPSGQTRC